MSLLARIQKRIQTPKQKAISHRPDLAGRVHIMRSGGSPPSEFAAQGYGDWATVYQSYSWLYKACTKVAENAAPHPLRVVNRNGETLDNHPLADFFEAGNESNSADEVWKLSFIDLVLAGEMFLEIVDDARGRPVEYWRRRPDLVGVIPDESKRPFTIKAGYQVNDEMYQYPDILPPASMFMAKFPNPTNPWRGLAPVNAIRDSVAIDVMAAVWSKSFLKGGARPDYALIAPAGITTSEREDYEQSLMDKFGGAGNSGKPIVLEDGVTDIKVLNWSPVDIQWLEQRKYSRDEVAAIVGVPDLIMGYGSEQYDNSDKMRAHLAAFWTLTLKPLIDFRDNSLTHFFRHVRPMLGRGERIETDLSAVGVLQEDISPQLENAMKLYQMGVPFNIIDEVLDLGVGAVPGGDMPPMSGGGVASTRSFFTKASHEDENETQLDEGEVDELIDLGLDELEAELRDQLNEITSGITAATAGDIVGRLQDPQLRERFINLWTALLTNWADYGANFGQLVVEEGLGTGAPLFDWTLANEAAARWAATHAGEVAKQMLDTSESLVQRELSKWIRDGGTIADLFDALGQPHIFGRSRANRAVVTEITAAISQGSIITWQNSGVVGGYRWNTNADGLVCPICRPLNQRITSAGGEFAPGITAPPAHVGCRCWLTPIIDVLEQRTFNRGNITDELMGRRAKNLGKAVIDLGGDIETAVSELTSYGNALDEMSDKELMSHYRSLKP